MRSFILDKEYTIICEVEDLENGFLHRATLLKNGKDQNSVACAYDNRTWESYEFETVLLKCINKNFKGNKKEKYRLLI